MHDRRAYEGYGIIFYEHVLVMGDSTKKKAVRFDLVQQVS